jgi:RimJ/RimL family protein N-acetyltransferase
MLDSTIIQTERLILRHVTVDDQTDLLRLFSDPIAMQFFPSIKNEEETRDWIDKTIKRYDEDGFGFYTCVNIETRQTIGYCGLVLQKDVDGIDEVEIGYGLIRDHWHNGFATEAAIGCKKYGFDVLRLEKMISLIRPENTPSIRVATRNRMKWKKDIMRWGYIHGLYSVTRSEELMYEVEWKNK